MAAESSWNSLGIFEEQKWRAGRQIRDSALSQGFLSHYSSVRSSLNPMTSVLGKRAREVDEPRLTIPRLIEAIFPTDERTRERILNQPQSHFFDRELFTIPKAMDRLESIIAKMRKSKCADKLKTGDWRREFEASDRYRELPDAIRNEREEEERETKRQREIHAAKKQSLLNALDRLIAQAKDVWSPTHCVFKDFERIRSYLPVDKL